MPQRLLLQYLKMYNIVCRYYMFELHKWGKLYHHDGVEHKQKDRSLVSMKLYYVYISLM